MTSLSEMVDYAKAQQQPNALADIATHFLEGASSGFDAGHAEALKRLENPLVPVDPALATKLGLSPTQKVPLDVYSKIIDAHAKLADAAANDAFNAQFAGKLQTKTEADNAAVQGRAATLADIGTKALAAGETAPDGNTVMGKLGKVVADANAPAADSSSSPQPEMTVSMEGGKLKRSLKFAAPDSKIVTPAQHDALINGDTAALSTAFPKGIPDWASRMVAERTAREADAAQKLKDAQEAKLAAAKAKAIAEGQARLTGVRGDTSLQRTEAQRDGSIQAYKTINDIKAEGRMPSKAEYYDILAQLYKARTGATPTDQMIRDLDSKTFNGDLGKAYTYFSGKPGAATTQGVLDNIQDFAKKSGRQADQLHAGYMRGRMLKPTILSDEEWKPVLDAGRGLSFAEATGDNGQDSTGKIKVSNGKETLLIDPADARNAKADGYNPV